MRKGNFIVLEGIDFSGKTTHSKKLVEWIKSKNYRVIATEEPTEGAIGKLIRNYLKRGDVSPTVFALLFAADRVEHIEKVINPLLSEGVIVVSDRYVESSIAYQAAGGLDVEWIENINRFAIEPDLTILLDIDPEVALTRKKEVRDSFENVEFLKKVRQIYLERARIKKHYIIDANRTIELVHQEIVKHVEPLLLKAQNL